MLFFFGGFEDATQAQLEAYCTIFSRFGLPMVFRRNGDQPWRFSDGWSARADDDPSDDGFLQLGSRSEYGYGGLLSMPLWDARFSAAAALDGRNCHPDATDLNDSQHTARGKYLWGDMWALAEIFATNVGVFRLALSLGLWWLLLPIYSFLSSGSAVPLDVWKRWKFLDVPTWTQHESGSFCLCFCGMLSSTAFRMDVLGAELLECIDQNHIALCGFCEGYLCLEHEDRNTKLHGMETSWHAECLEFVGRCLGGGTWFFHIFLKGPPKFYTPPENSDFEAKNHPIDNGKSSSNIHHFGVPAVHFPGSACFRGFLPVNPNIFFFKGPTCIDWHRWGVWIWRLTGWFFRKLGG